MGYVHTYGLTKEIEKIPAEAFSKIEEIVEKYKDILRFECDEDRAPQITNTNIRFNGCGEHGYETFSFSVKEETNYCKTNVKSYDAAITKILLVLFHYIPEFNLSGDGFWIHKSQADEFNRSGKVELDGYWNEALEYMKDKYGIEFDWYLKVSKSGGHEYYCMDICRKVIENATKSKKIQETKKKDTVSETNKASTDKTSTGKTTKTKEKNNKESSKKNENEKDENIKDQNIEEKSINEKGTEEKNSTDSTGKTEYSKEEKSEYFKNQLEELKNSIEYKIDDFLKNSEELKNFIRFKNKYFKTYSFRNSLLIYNQFPSANYVAGFSKWKELGYSVIKGSKAIKILVPLIKKNENSKNESSKAEYTQEIYGFKAVNVFDISQVIAGPNAEPIPSLDMDIHPTEHMQYSENILLEACKEFVASRCPLHIVSDDSLGDCLGLTNGREIFVLDTKKPLDMAAVLVHEFSHFKNHYKENRNTLTKDEKETEAEITAMIFSSYFNLNHENRFKYLAMYRKNRELDKCFTTALSTFDYILLGEDGKNGLESILQGLSMEETYEPKAS